jgi:hypothetical protein
MTERVTSEVKPSRTPKHSKIPTWLWRPVGWGRQKLTNMSMLPHVLWMVLLAALVTGGIAFGIWLLAKKPSLASLVAGMTLLDLIRVALLVTGGIGGIVALVVAYRKQKLGERAEAREEEAAKLARRADEREDTKLYGERFAAASEQLASKEAMVRLAGVYAMSLLADDWQNGRQICIDVLCSYMRQLYIPPPRSPGPENMDSYISGREEQQIRRAIMSGILRRLRVDSPSSLSWNGCDFDFTETNFDELDFSDIRFTGGSLILSDFQVFGSGVVSFRDAIFSGAAVVIQPKPGCARVIELQRSQFRSGDIRINVRLFDGRISFLNSIIKSSCKLTSYVDVTGESRVVLQGIDLQSKESSFHVTLESQGNSTVSVIKAQIKAGRIGVDTQIDSRGAIVCNDVDITGGRFSVTTYPGSQVEVRAAPTHSPNFQMVEAYLHRGETFYDSTGGTA